MDGDYADPTALRDHLARGGDLYLDEAHSFGLYNNPHHHPQGLGGFASHHGVRPSLLVGTFGKSLGCAGAFAAASSTVCTWIRGNARSFVYSTGMAPAVVAQVNHALDLASGPDGHARRERLWSNIDNFIRGMSLDIPESRRSPIVPITVGPNESAIALSTALLERGWHVQAIRPPTVPPGTARLRITLSAAHSPVEISAFTADLRALL
jgi:8-amino-7-oxononanoate synthase